MTLRERIGEKAMRAVFRASAGWERIRTGASFNPMRPAFVRDPYPVYRRLRELDPVHRSPLIPGWVLSRHEDIAFVLRDGRFSSDERHWSRYDRMARKRERMGLPDFYEDGMASMLRLDAPDHTRLRSLVSKAFTPRAIERMRPRIEALVKELLGRVDAGEMELVEALASPLPVIVIAEMLGVPAEDQARFRHWSDEVVRTLGEATLEDIRASQKASGELRDYFAGIVEARRSEPRDDLVSALVAAEDLGDRLSENELFGTLVLLLVAGNETTTNLISNSVLALCRNPEQLAWLREDGERIPGAVEELLRYDSPVQLTSRMLTQDIDLFGRRMRRGEQVILLLGSGNRDPEVYQDPERLDVTRQNVRHLSFSLGVHFCLGAQLARMEGVLALRGLLERFERIELAETEVSWRNNTVLRGPSRLRLRVA